MGSVLGLEETETKHWILMFMFRPHYPPVKLCAFPEHQSAGLDLHSRIICILCMYSDPE